MDVRIIATVRDAFAARLVSISRFEHDHGRIGDWSCLGDAIAENAWRRWRTLYSVVCCLTGIGQGGISWCCRRSSKISSGSTDGSGGEPCMLVQTAGNVRGDRVGSIVKEVGCVADREAA